MNKSAEINKKTKYEEYYKQFGISCFVLNRIKEIATDFIIIKVNSVVLKACDEPNESQW